MTAPDHGPIRIVSTSPPPSGHQATQTTVVVATIRETPDGEFIKLPGWGEVFLPKRKTDGNKHHG